MTLIIVLAIVAVLAVAWIKMVIGDRKAAVEFELGRHITRGYSNLRHLDSLEVTDQKTETQELLDRAERVQASTRFSVVKARQIIAELKQMNALLEKTHGIVTTAYEIITAGRANVARGEIAIACFIAQGWDVARLQRQLAEHDECLAQIEGRIAKGDFRAVAALLEVAPYHVEHHSNPAVVLSQREEMARFNADEAKAAYQKMSTTLQVLLDEYRTNHGTLSTTGLALCALAAEQSFSTFLADCAKLGEILDRDFSSAAKVTEAYKLHSALQQAVKQADEMLHNVRCLEAERAGKETTIGLRAQNLLQLVQGLWPKTTTEEGRLDLEEIATEAWRIACSARQLSHGTSDAALKRLALLETRLQHDYNPPSRFMKFLHFPGHKGYFMLGSGCGALFILFAMTVIKANA